MMHRFKSYTLRMEKDESTLDNYKTYKGHSIDGEISVCVYPKSKVEGEYYNLKHYVRHSPDGFNWGYSGSGPSELARCILIDFFEGDETLVTNAMYMKLKDDWVSGLNTGHWILTYEDLFLWVKDFLSPKDPE